MTTTSGKFQRLNAFLVGQSFRNVRSSRRREAFGSVKEAVDNLVLISKVTEGKQAGFIISDTQELGKTTYTRFQISQ